MYTICQKSSLVIMGLDVGLSYIPILRTGHALVLCTRRLDFRLSRSPYRGLKAYRALHLQREGKII